ncbi:hypothetical protein ACROYT_G013432 [Oculina patagonica]
MIDRGIRICYELLTMASAVPEEIYNKHLSCAICLGEFKEPKVLACLHTYCKECLVKLTVKQRPVTHVTCPECRQDTRDEKMKDWKKDWYGQDGGIDVSVRAPHLLANLNLMLPMLDDIVYSSKKSITLKRTSTQRSDSSASESSSPSDKRHRNTKHIELEGEVQEVFEGAVEASLAVDMSEMMAEKLDEILAKLNKLDSIETTLNNLCSKMATVESDVSKLKDGARVTDGKLEKMDNGLQWMNTEVEDLKLKITLLETAKKDLHTQQLYAEAYSRRENLKFFGLAERETKSSSNISEVINTRNILFEFLDKRLGLENPEKEIELQRVHRIGKPTAGKTRPIIARFLRFQDREMVLKASFRLQDPEIKVLEDYPQEIIERRRKQMKKLKDAKKNGMKVSFSKAEEINSI